MISRAFVLVNPGVRHSILSHTGTLHDGPVQSTEVLCAGHIAAFWRLQCFGVVGIVVIARADPRSSGGDPLVNPNGPVSTHS